MIAKKNTWSAKLKRTLTCILPVAKNRKGECINCGECCKLPKKCLFLKYRFNGQSYCSIWPLMILNCRKYPRTKLEWLTEDTCGFRFE